MPNNGLVFQADAYEYRVGSVFNGSSHDASETHVDTKAHFAEGNTNWVDNAVTVNSGIYLSVSSSDNGLGTLNSTWFYNGPGAPFGGWSYSLSDFRDSMEIRIRINGLKIYSKLTGSLFRVTWSSIDIWIDGGYHTTLGGSAVDATSFGVGPNYINYLAVPLTIAGTCSASTSITPPTYDPCNPGADVWSTATSCSSTATGGWRFGYVHEGVGDGYDWYRMPVTAWENDPPSGTCSELSFGSEVDVVDSWTVHLNIGNSSSVDYVYVGRTGLDVHVELSCLVDDEFTVIYSGDMPSECWDPCTESYQQGWVDTYYTEVHSTSQSGTARIIPDLERAITRMNDDYLAMWFRGHFPLVQGETSRACMVDGVTSSATDTVDVYDDLGSSFLEIVTNSLSDCEDAFPAHVYCETTRSKNKTYSKTYNYEISDTCLCPPSGAPDPSTLCEGSFSWSCSNINDYTIPTDSSSESISLVFPSYVGSGGDYMSHASSAMRYHTTWCNPHWLLAFWRQDWELDGSAQDWATYWGPIKEQHMYNAAISGAHPKLNKRNSIVASCLETDNGHTPFLDTYFSGLRWIGVSRFKILDTGTLPSSHTYSSSLPGLWEYVGMTADFTGTKIEMTDIEEPAWIQTHLATWTDYPYLQLLRAKSVQVGWGTGIDVNVKFIGIDDEVANFANAGGTYDIPQGVQSSYAGTWAIDNGAGIIDDGYDDWKINGISNTLMSTPLNVSGFQLGGGEQYAKMRFEIKPKTGVTSSTINWPVFGLNSTAPEQYWVNSRVMAGLWPDTSFLWGHHTYYIPMLGFQNPPFITAMDTTNTIVDAMADYYRLFSTTDGDLATLVTTMIATYYDTYEGQSIAVADKLGHSFILPQATTNEQNIRWALVNSFSEIPPLGCFPFRKRDAQWQPLGTHAQVVYDLCKENRYLVSNKKANCQITTSAGIGIGNYITTTPANWSVYQYSQPVTNSETANYHIFTATAAGIVTTNYSIGLASVRPWHGYYCNYKQKLAGNKMVTCHERYELDQIYGWCWGGIATYKAQDANGLVIYTASNVCENATDISSAFFNNESYLCFVGGNGLSIVIRKLKYSVLDDIMLIYPTTNATSPSLCFYPDGTGLLYWIEGGKPCVLRLDSNFTTLGAKELTNLEDKSSIDAMITIDYNGAISIKMAAVDNTGVLAIYTSADGKNFS